MEISENLWAVTLTHGPGPRPAHIFRHRPGPRPKFGPARAPHTFRIYLSYMFNMLFYDQGFHYNPLLHSSFKYYVSQHLGLNYDLGHSPQGEPKRA